MRRYRSNVDEFDPAHPERVALHPLPGGPSRAFAGLDEVRMAFVNAGATIAQLDGAEAWAFRSLTLRGLDRLERLSGRAWYLEFAESGRIPWRLVQALGGG